MNVTAYSGTTIADPSNSFSNFWNDCPVLEIRAGIRRGWFQEDDFCEFSPLPYVPTNPSVQTVEGGIAGRYKVISAAAGTWTPVNAVGATDIGGGLIRALCDTAGDQAALGFAGSPFVLNRAQGGKLWGEARIAMTGIATNNCQVFVGLGETNVMTFGVATPLGDNDAANASGAMIGLNVLEDGLGALNACYQDRSVTWLNPTAGTAIGQMAANTFIKVGWVYDPNDRLNAITWYVNGVRTCSMTAATLAGLTNLDTKGLGLLAAMYADSAGTANFLYIDWWRCYQLAP